jgi:hypothetical protein
MRKGFLRSVEMLKNLNVHGGFTPATLAPPQGDNPREGNNSSIAQRRGGPGGQALSPPSKHVSFLFHTMIKGIIQSLLSPSGKVLILNPVFSSQKRWIIPSVCKKILTVHTIKEIRSCLVITPMTNLPSITSTA